MQTLWAHLHQTAPTLADLPTLDPVLDRALAEDPEQRYPSCSAFVEEARAATGLGLSPTAVTRSRPRVGRRLVLAGAALLAAAVTAAVALAFLLGGKGGIVVPPNSVVALDPASGRVVTTIPLALPGVAAASDDWVWALGESSEGGSYAIVRIDATSKRVVSTFTVTGDPVALLAARGSLWVSTRQGHVFRIDPASDDVTGDWTLPNAGKGVGLASLFQGVGSLAFGGGTVWVASFRAISQIDPATSNLVPRRSSVWGPLAFGFGSVWTLNFRPGRPELIRLAPGTLQRQQSVFLPRGRGIAVGEGSVWVADDGGRVWRIDPARYTIESVFEVGGRISGLAVGGGSVWAATDAGYVVRIGPASGNVERIAIGRVPAGIAVGAGLVWVGVGHPGPVRSSLSVSGRRGA